jgi:hypothetical protein
LEIRHNKHGIKPADYSLKLDSTLVVTDPSFIKAVESASHKGLCTFVDGFVTDPAKGHEEVAKVTFAINASKKCSPSDWDLRAKNKDYQDAFVYECKVVYTGTNVRDLTQLGMSQEAAVIASKSIEHRVFHHHSEAVQS